ncbi:hypothetical protein BDV29DRAFT_179804 [Aspergillus leporis]|uniref:Uncharacterized protein n=1 Tax=Aspergillus leporis TaxID=41062 RepID=A0A5N5WRG5_9EURO|nr:hypothetical protein BDV29DRAFT_179804 [Aspergillus leporis]
MMVSAAYPSCAGTSATGWASFVTFLMPSLACHTAGAHVDMNGPRKSHLVRGM